METWFHAVAGASIADPGVSYPARVGFEFVFAAQCTFEVRVWHGAGDVGLGMASEFAVRYVHVTRWRSFLLLSPGLILIVVVVALR